MVHYHHSIIVRPRQKFPFPIDMLRYESAFPHSEMDANKISETFDIGIFDRERVGTIALRRIGTNRLWEPRKERWLSFGWEVVDFQLLARN